MLNDGIKLAIHLLDRVARFTAAFEAVKNMVGNVAFNVRCVEQQD